MRNWKSHDQGTGTTSDVPDTPRPTREAEGLGLDVLVAMVSASPDGFVVMDIDLRIVYANPAYCALFGHPADRLLGQKLLSFTPKRDWQTVLTYLAHVRDGRSDPLLRVVRRPDGSELELEVRATVLEIQGRPFFLCVARDVTERQQQARQAAALAQAAASVAARDSIDTVLEAISESALAGTRALAAWVTLENEEGLAAWVGAAGLPDGFREHLQSAVAAAAAARFKQALAARRVTVYSDWRHQIEREFGTLGVAEALRSLPWQPAAIVPLRHQSEVVGLLTAVYREGEMPYEAETTFLAVLADQATTAAAHAQLLAATREKVALEERQRLARELHDSVSQSLYAIHLAAQRARERLEQDAAGMVQIDHVLRLAEMSQAEMRALIFDLRPEALETEGLIAALNRRMEALRARYGIAAELIGGAEPELPLEVKQALHRIGQEALWNTVKHARARRVDVRLEADADSVVLEVADDGVGFDPSGSFSGHLGLRSMRERAVGVGGSVDVVSARGHGTRVVVRVPWAPPRPRRRIH